MRRPRLGSFLLFGAVVALSAGVAAGGVGDLTYVKSLPPGISLGFGGTMMKKSANPAAIGLTHPSAVVTSNNSLVKLAFDSDDPKAEILDVARIDTTGKGDFTNAEKVKLVKLVKAGTSRYRQARLDLRVVETTYKGQKIRVVVSGQYYKTGTGGLGRISVYVVAEGQCKFGDGVRKVLVVDSNRNMKIGDVTTRKIGSREYKSADSCMIADENGKFVGNPRPTMLRMGQPIQAAGKWYVLTGGNMKVAAKPMPGGLAKLVINSPRWQCMLTGNGYTLNVTGGTEPQEVPAGEYRLRMFRLYSQADTTKPCPNIYGSQSKPIKFEAGKTVSPSLGTGLTATVQTKFDKGKVRFSVGQSDAVGSRISTIYGPGGKRPAAPQIDVIDQAGKVVYTAKLAYG